MWSQLSGVPVHLPPAWLAARGAWQVTWAGKFLFAFPVGQLNASGRTFCRKSFIFPLSSASFCLVFLIKKKPEEHQECCLKEGRT